MLCIVPAADEGCVGQVPEQDHHHWNQVPSYVISCFAQACLNYPGPSWNPQLSFNFGQVLHGCKAKMLYRKWSIFIGFKT